MKIEPFTENTAEYYLYKNRIQTNIIYIITLATIIIIVVLLPFIYIDISISALGKIRPITEKASVTAFVTEIVDSVYVKEGDKLKKGDIILTQRFANKTNQQQYKNELINEINDKLKDLEHLVKGCVPTTFFSMSIREDYIHYLSQHRQIETILEQYKIEWERNKILFDKGLISESEYNKFYYQYVDKKNELVTLVHEQKKNWCNELYNLQKEQKEYLSTIKELKTDKKAYELRSPVSGSLDQFVGIYKGCIISAGQQIAIISPNGKLCIEVCISPHDIAFIKKGQDVRIQVDALNYNEWGTLHGIVKNISSDMFEDGNGNYYYKVKCILNQNYLTLRNTNHKAFIKKGMSVVAHFIVTKQSLFTLLYKNIDEWANPTQYREGK